MGNEIGREWSIVIGAPILTGLTVLAVIAIVWGVMYFLYRHRNEALNEYLRREQAETSRLRGRLAEYEKSVPPTVEEPAPPSAIEAPRPPTSQELGRLAHRAVQAARHARAHNSSKRDKEVALTPVIAFLTTLSKQKGIQMPPLTGRLELDLEAGCRLLEGVGPFLREGHDDEARRYSIIFAEDYQRKLDAGKGANA